MRMRMVLCKVIGQIIATFIPTELELFLEDAVFDPVIAHIVCFREFGAHCAGKNAVRC